MKDEYLLLEDSYKDYKLKVIIEKGETVWYMNGVPIMFGTQYHSCYQVDVVGFDHHDHNILVAGLGHGNTTELASQYGRVTCIELLESVFDLYKSRVGDNYDYDILIDDFYDYVNNTSEKYDAILMQLDFPGEESEIQYCLKSNERIYTEEFLTRIKYILNNDGVFVTEGVVKIGQQSDIFTLLRKVGFEIKEYRKPFEYEKMKQDVEHVLWRCQKID